MADHAPALEAERAAGPPPLAKLGDLPPVRALSNRGPDVNDDQPKQPKQPNRPTNQAKPRKAKIHVPFDQQIAAVVRLFKGTTTREQLIREFAVDGQTILRWRKVHAQLAKRMIELEKKAEQAERAEDRPPFDKRPFASPVVELRPSAPPSLPARAAPPTAAFAPAPPRGVVYAAPEPAPPPPPPPPTPADDPGAYARSIMASRQAAGAAAPGELERLRDENARLRARLEAVTAERDAMVEAHRLLASYGAPGGHRG